jgi:hypothetical protein
MTNTTATQTQAAANTSKSLRTPDAATIANCGGCLKCATYAFGGGHSDPEILKHRAAHLRAMVKGLRDIWRTSNTERFLRATEKAMRINQSHCATRNVFALALTLVYGPTGLHKSWRGADGRPSAEALQVEEISRTMANAAARVDTHLDTIERDVENWIKDQGM